MMERPVRCRALIAALLLAIVGPGTEKLRAEDIQQWTWLNPEFQWTRKFSTILHGQLRSDRPMAEFWQARVGTVGLYQMRPGMYAVGGYYYRRERAPVSGGNGDSHRVFGGLQNYFFTPETERHHSVLIESRALMEHFFAGPAGTATDFTRFRYRARASFANWKVSPLVGHEAFFHFGMRPGEGFGLWGNRPHAGVRWRPNARTILDVGYYYDARAPGIGTPKHLFFTNLLIRVRKRPDVDFPNRPTF